MNPAAQQAVAALDGRGRDDRAPRFSQRLLEELIYERVRTQIDLLQLGWFEADLDASIERVLGGLEDPGAPPAHTLAALLIDDAWERVEAEWRAQRNTGAPECAMCEADLAIADPVEPAVMDVDDELATRARRRSRGRRRNRRG